MFQFDRVVSRKCWWLLLSILGLLMATAPTATAGWWSESQEAEESGSRPDLTDPILCETIRRFRDFDKREEPLFVVGEKLQIYIEPFNYFIVRDQETKRYRAHLTIDLKLRIKGQESVYRSLNRVVDYETTTENPPTPLYLGAGVVLEGLRPGDFEVELILRDEIAPEKPTASRKIPITIESRSQRD